MYKLIFFHIIQTHVSKKKKKCNTNQVIGNVNCIELYALNLYPLNSK